MMPLQQQEIELWAEDTLFGNRMVEGIRLELTPTQKAIQRLAVDIIMKWEGRAQ